jgi:hypothetical protein
MTGWEYRIMSLPRFEGATISSEPSAVVTMLNEQGADGWEAIGMMTLPTGSVAVLMKRPTVDS